MLAISSTFCSICGGESFEVFLYISWSMITSALKDCSRRRTCLAFVLSARPFTFQEIILTIGQKRRRCHRPSSVQWFPSVQLWFARPFPLEHWCTAEQG